MYSEKEARELVLKAGLQLVDKKLIARTWGNISARISDTQFVISPSGKPYDGLAPEDMVVVNIDDCSYEGETKPSSEKGAHAVSYRLRPECNFIVHTHQFFASAVAADEQSMDFAPCARYGMPGTDKLVRNIERCLEQYKDDKAFLMAKHGTLILGDSYDDAFSLAEKLENDSEKLYYARIPSHDEFKYDEVNINDIRVDGFPAVKVQRDPYVMECCLAGIRMKPYVDDFAMIAGVNILCVENDIRAIVKALKNRNAVLVKGVGAVCVGIDMSDAEAVAMIVSKNCAAVCYARNAKPINMIHAGIMRKVYLTSYSKRKFEG